MTEEIKDLISKIKQEGVQAAEMEAVQIKTEAQEAALRIIAQAKKESQMIIEQAHIQAQRLNDSTQAVLQQAGRDLLINLRQEIINILGRLIKLELKQAMSAAELAKIILVLIKNAPLSLGSQIIVSLNTQDKEKLEQGFLKQLIEEIKRPIMLKSAEGMQSGFIISFDGGRSIFDFSDQALSEYISGYLRPELRKILNLE